jgi:hypothetical protein
MKIIDIPHSGKRGVYVTQGGRYGQISRAYVIPGNPRTARQQRVRAIFKRVTARWRSLQEPQRAAWTAASSEVSSSGRLGQDGTLTGQQLFNKIKCTLAQFGRDQVDTPPAYPVFPKLARQNLIITNTGGVIALKLTCPTSPGENTIVRGSPPVSQGRGRWNDFRVLGMCPAPVGGSADITSLYTALHGAPPVGRKVFIRVNQLVDGWEDSPTTFVAIVPAAA